MSGHSKWSTIKRKKGARDLQRGKMFTKLGRTIVIAAREGGGDPNLNFSLRLAMEKAKQVNMPAENVERCVKKGTGELDDGEVVESVVYGGYGPGGVAFVVDVLTDNKNRTVSELRRVFEEHGGNLSEASSVLWQFKEKGRVIVKCAKLEKSKKYGKEDEEIPVDHDEVVMKLMDIDGVEDIKDWKVEDDLKYKYCDVVTDPKDFAKVRAQIEKLGYVIDESELIKVPENTIETGESTDKKVLSLMEALDDHDDVENVWVNADV